MPNELRSKQKKRLDLQACHKASYSIFIRKKKTSNSQNIITAKHFKSVWQLKYYYF